MLDDEKGSASASEHSSNSFDIRTYYEDAAGHLVVEPEEAKREFGKDVASQLKTSKDGRYILWPQPTDDPDDPQNWSERRKTLHLVLITIATFIPDFCGAIGIASLFGLARTFHTTTNEINELTTSWSVFLLAWGTLFSVILVRRFGRLPVLFWSQVVGLIFLIAATFSPTLNTFAAFRCLNSFFSTCPQATGLYVVTDLYPFHLQARKLNVWTIGFIVSPFASPFLFGYVVHRHGFRVAYGIGSILTALVVLLIAFFMEETMYDRKLNPVPKPEAKGLRLRVETLIGITGAKMQKYRAPWSECISRPFRIVWRPQLIGILVFVAMLFGFTIGVTVTFGIFVGEPAPIGYGYNEDIVATVYLTPIVAVIVGEIAGRYLNDFIMNRYISRKNGVFDAEVRLWSCYLAVLLNVIGFVLIGVGLQHRLSLAVMIVGWFIHELGAMIGTVAVYAYCNDCFPKYPGEVSMLVNMARTLGGFSVAYFQVVWTEKNGAIQAFGCEAAIVAGIFFLTVPFIQWKGQGLRERFALQ